MAFDRAYICQCGTFIVHLTSALIIVSVSKADCTISLRSSSLHHLLLVPLTGARAPQCECDCNFLSPLKVHSCTPADSRKHESDEHSLTQVLSITCTQERAHESENKWLCACYLSTLPEGRSTVQGPSIVIDGTVAYFHALMSLHLSRYDCHLTLNLCGKLSLDRHSAMTGSLHFALRPQLSRRSDAAVTASSTDSRARVNLNCW